MEFSVQNICGFLIRSRLLTPDGVKTMYQRWQDEAKDGAGNVGQFARWLVAQHYVTEYQAGLLARGLPDNFFLGEYKILDRIGQGAMAGVYKAIHNLGQVVAIKVLPPSKARHPKILGRFERETDLALRLKHPNIVRSFHIGKADSLHYLVMEYLEGETLDEVLRRRGRLPPEEAVRLIYQALQGLQHLHELGLVHRDLKPANLMLVPAPGAGQPDTTLQATLKILDVGLAKQLFEENASGNSSKRNLTGLGVLLGTPDYLSPEQARSAATADIRSDIYSLGCVLYHTLAGVPPFPDTNVITQMVRHLTETARPLKEFNAAIPDGLQQIIDWMIAKEPSQRYPTPERAAQALQVYLAAGTGPLRTPEGDPKTRLFLSWVEENSMSRKEDRPSAARPGAPGGGTDAGAAGRNPEPSKPPGRSIRGKRRRRSAAAEINTPMLLDQPATHAAQYPMAAKALPSDESFDVELVAVDAPPSGSGQGKLLRLGRRDLVMQAIGAVLLAVILGMIYGAFWSSILLIVDIALGSLLVLLAMGFAVMKLRAFFVKKSRLLSEAVPLPAPAAPE